MTIYKADLSEFAYQELQDTAELINTYLRQSRGRWFLKKIVYNNNTANVCIVDDDNNYWMLDMSNKEETKLRKLDKDEKHGEQWEG